MKKFFKITSIITLFLFCVFFGFTVKAITLDGYERDLPSNKESYERLEYVIDAYDIDVVVNKNNTFDITEHITAHFNVYKHGIIRKIPMRNTVTRLNGTSSNNRAVISNLKVSENYTQYVSDGMYTIKIGDADTTLIGAHDYVISYTYNIGKDPLKEIDELYFNLIGNEWDTVIGNVTFKVTMPDTIDANNLGFSSGPLGSTQNDLVYYTVNGNVISGTYNGILNAGEALTIRCELPDGYFVGAGYDFNMVNLLIIFLPIVFAIIAVISWKKYGKDDEVIETVEFYPPEGYNSLEVGFLYNGIAQNSDVTSLMIYLANKGYIKIVETEEKILFINTQGFKIIKLKEYDGNNINEKTFLNGLFSSGKTEVKLSELENRFYKTTKKILSNVNSKENINKIIEKKSSSKSKLLNFLAFISYMLIIVPPILLYGEPVVLVFGILFPLIGFMLFFKSLMDLVKNGIKYYLSAFIFATIFGSIFSLVPTAIFILPSLLIDIFYLYAFIIGVICIFIILVCVEFMPKRTPYGSEILGKLRGFKNFLETAEKDRLEAMVLENPTYFYDILPYAYVLDVSDKWISNFEAINIQEPTWYDSPNTFDIVSFNNFVNNAMSSANSAMSSSPSSSSSGGSSGGGSSGGGSGGGGGSSW